MISFYYKRSARLRKRAARNVSRTSKNHFSNTLFDDMPGLAWPANLPKIIPKKSNRITTSSSWWIRTPHPLSETHLLLKINLKNPRYELNMHQLFPDCTETSWASRENGVISKVLETFSGPSRLVTREGSFDAPGKQSVIRAPRAPAVFVLLSWWIQKNARRTYTHGKTRD